MSVVAETEAKAAGSARPDSLRARLHAQLDPRARPQGGISPLNKALAVAVVACVLIAILDTEASVAQAAPAFFAGAELFFTALFSIEYLARVWAAPEDPRYRGFFGRLRYVVSPWALIDLVAILPALLSGMGSATLILRAARLMRLIRLARLGALSEAAAAMSEALRRRRYELILTAGLGMLLLLVSATLLYFVEGKAQPDDFGSIPRALWWAVATMTTVGYGDVFPVTVPGKMLSAVAAIAGIAFVAMPTGILAAAFSDALRVRHENQVGGTE
ncbi:MAG TPA: ion transporter [Caulobacteraceae bacterium]|nr:ion transporter [Caulobacteraceae bacterium]